MIRKFIYSIAAFMLMVSCSTPISQEQISGVYVKELTFDVIHPLTDENLGKGRIRDTIFIAPKQDGFEVSNNKWRIDDFNDRGWQNLQHEMSQPMPTYRVTFDPTDSSLNPVMSGFFLSLKLNLKDKKLQKGKNKGNLYSKVK